MARMSIDDMFLRDPRVAQLASLCGWSVRETRGCLLDVWAICYDQMTPMLSVGLVNITAGNTASGLADFAKHLLESELATVHRSTKLVICGVEDRIKYLIAKKESGRQGGLNSARTRGKDTKQNHVSLQPVLKQPGSTPQALGNPVVPDVASVVVAASAPDGDVDPEQITTVVAPLALAAVGSKAKASKPKPGAPNDLEMASVREVLYRLEKQSGVAYRGADAHVKLIVGRLRGGCTETDLRAVIGYCATELKWKDKPEMQKYLRPETLFGAESIERYVDAARTWWAKLDLPPVVETPVRRGSGHGVPLDLTGVQLGEVAQ